MLDSENINLIHEIVYIVGVAVPAVVGTFYILRWFNAMVANKLTVEHFEQWVQDHEKKHDTFESNMTAKIDRIESNSRDLKDYVSAMTVKTTTTLETMLQLFGIANKSNKI